MPKIPRLSKETSLFSKGAISAALKVLSDRIALVVSDSSTSSSITVTPGFVSAITNLLRITASDGTSTVIEGGKLKANAITASEIDATDLHVAAANIDGTLTASQINASGLTIGQSQVTGLTTALNDKADTSDIPTNVSDLTNDSGFQTSSQVESAITGKGYQTSSQVESAITSKGYQTSSQVNTAITSKGYQTSTQVESAITSKGYATTTQAQGYATTAKSEAISAAATDATTKANAAQTAATNAANTATDNKLKSYSTTAQANNLYDAKGAAQTVQNNLDNLEIGGRNLLRNSSVEHSQSSSTPTWFEWQITDAPLETSQDYTFSFDAKTSNGTDVFYVGFANGSAATQENMATGIKPTTAYGRMSVTARTTKTNIRSIIVSSTKQYGHGNESNSGGTLYIKNVKLESGNKATDWTPAPEDMATAESLAGTNESLEGAIEDIGELSDQLVGTVTEQNKTITDIQTYLNSLRKDLDAEIQSRQQWLNFNSAEGLVIGAAGSSFKTVTTNTSQQFRSGGTVLAETSGTEFVAPVMRSDQLLIGNWMWTRRDNGNLSLKWIG